MVLPDKASWVRDVCVDSDASYIAVVEDAQLSEGYVFRIYDNGSSDDLTVYDGNGRTAFPVPSRCMVVNGRVVVAGKWLVCLLRPVACVVQSPFPFLRPLNTILVPMIIEDRLKHFFVDTGHPTSFCRDKSITQIHCKIHRHWSGLSTPTTALVHSTQRT